MKQTKQYGALSEVLLKHLPIRLHCNRGFMEMQMQPLGKTPNDVAEQSNRRISTVDRIALAATFAVSILILVMFALTIKWAMQPFPTPATVAMSSRVGLPASKPNRRMPTAPATRGKD